MNDWERLHRQAEGYKKAYPPGTRIVLLGMENDQNPVERGTRGTVRAVDDIGTLHCSFDNGRTLGVVPGEDSFRKLTEKELAEEQSGAIQEAAEVSAPSWKVVMVGEFGVKRDFNAVFQSEEEAKKFAESEGWYYIDENQFEWRLEVEKVEEKYQHLSQSADFDVIKENFSPDMMKHIEETLVLYLDTDKIEADENGSLRHVDGADFFEPAIAWYTGMTDTQSFVSEYGDVKHDKAPEPIKTKESVVPDEGAIQEDEKYQEVEVFGIPALFDNARTGRDKLPEGLYVYDLRGPDDDPYYPCTIENYVFVNHAASVITAEPVELPEEGWLYLGDGLCFTGRELTIQEFLREPAIATERLYTVDNDKYLYIQRTDTGVDYTFYDKSTKQEIDGGQLDVEFDTLAEAAREICKFHELGNPPRLQIADLGILDEIETVAFDYYKFKNLDDIISAAKQRSEAQTNMETPKEINHEQKGIDQKR